MHYPWWYVPHMTAPMLIAAIATIHVLVSHYAVGGGLFLAVEISHAHRTKNRAYLDYLKSHAWFFILITVVFGAITGVGIWWTIGLASPLATEILIRVFVFGWAIEYVFFVLELAAAFLLIYFWDLVKPKTHMLFAWVYAIAAWISLVLITGITAFMLHSGLAGGEQPSEIRFWPAFFNPQFIPQVLARTGGSLLLASMYVYFHASIWARSDALKILIGRRSAVPALVGAVLIVAGGLLWLLNLPEFSLISLQKAPALNIFMAIVFAVTVAVFVMLYIGPYRNPTWMTPGFGILFLLFGVVAVATGEFVREAVRKPFIVHNVVLSSQVLTSEVGDLQANGLLEGGPWTHALVAAKYPQVIDEEGGISSAALAALPAPARLDLGATLFQHACNDCHAIEQGLSAVSHLVMGWSDERIHDVARRPERFQHYMPPFAGTDEEARMLAEWMISIRPEPPGDMWLGGEIAAEGE